MESSERTVIGAAQLGRSTVCVGFSLAPPQLLFRMEQREEEFKETGKAWETGDLLHSEKGTPLLMTFWLRSWMASIVELFGTFACWIHVSERSSNSSLNAWTGERNWHIRHSPPPLIL